MSRLLDPRKTTELKLPSFPDDSISMYDGLLLYQFKDIDKAETDYDKGLKTVCFLIKSWSFTGEDDKPLPVTEETLERLPQKDFAILMEHVQKSFEINNLKKKKD